MESSLSATRSRIAALAIACAPWPAIASPAQTSVWIEASRGAEVRFSGHRLPRRAEGMGVVMGSAREVATAAHVVWRADSITVTDPQGATSRARVVCIDAALDIALLRLEQAYPHVATVRTTPAVRGEPVDAVDRPDPDDTPQLLSGLVEASRWTSHGVPASLILSGIKGRKGMSGGGLFDAAGDLLGIIIRINGAVGYLSALPVAELCARFARCAGGHASAARPPAAACAATGQASTAVRMPNG